MRLQVIIIKTQHITNTDTHTQTTVSKIGITEDNQIKQTQGIQHKTRTHALNIQQNKINRRRTYSKCQWSSTQRVGLLRIKANEK
jgi:hypothetical protein